MTDTTGASMEKDFSNTPPAASQNGSGNGMMNGGGTPLLRKDLDHETARRQIQRAGSIALIPELFEKIYFTPQNTVKGDLRKTFMYWRHRLTSFRALLGLVMALTPFSCDIMGWRGAGGNGAASTLVATSDHILMTVNDY